MHVVTSSRRPNPNATTLAFARRVPSERELPLVGVTVLVIEDDAFVAAAISRLVERGGGRVVVASSIERARVALGAEPLADVALLDLELAGGDGLKLAEELHRSRTTFIVYTGYAELYFDACLWAGAWDVLEKPSEPEDLLDSLRGAVGRTRRFRDRFASFSQERTDGMHARTRDGDADARDRAAAFLDDLVRHVRETTMRGKRHGRSRVVEIAVLSASGLGIKRIAAVTGTSPSNVNQCLNVVRDRAGWRSPHDALRWYLARLGVDLGEFLARVLSSPAGLERAMCELIGRGPV